MVKQSCDVPGFEMIDVWRGPGERVQGGEHAGSFAFLLGSSCLEGFEPVVGLLPVVFGLLVFGLVHGLVEYEGLILGDELVECIFGFS